MSTPNAGRDTFTTPTESAKKVAFTYGDPLDLIADDTCIGCLLELGALLHTRRYDENTCRTYTATDQEGLEALVNSGTEAVTSMLSGISSVSRAVALANDELNGDHVSQIGWLVSGLSYIAMQLHERIDDVRYEIQRDFGGGTSPAG